MLEMIDLEKAERLALAEIKPVKTEKVFLKDSHGRVLARPVTALLDIPPFDRSPLDGYALKGEDTGADLPVELRVIGEVPAGTNFLGHVDRGKTVKILTGSPLPTGANAVIRQEDTECAAQPGFVRILKCILPGANISRRGEDIQAGETLLAAGKGLTPAAIGVLASQGISKVSVFARPMVAIASTGDELVNVEGRLNPGQIYNSNYYTLAAMVREWGGQALPLGLVRDKVEDLAAAIRRGLDSADLVVTTGGASVGSYDVTLQAMQSAGVRVLFRRIAMKPGTPVICGQKDGKLVIGLSGNPAAAMISASLLLGPAVRKLAGWTAYFPRKIKSVSEASFGKSSGVRRLIRASAGWHDGKFTVRFPQQQQPGVLKSMLGTNALVDLPPGNTIECGQIVQVFLLDEWRDSNDAGNLDCG
ncbi:MAG TPA: gephyrin-like molybdotransferase Glp [Desulfobacteria bacterium]|nr:gephyrin-like molybdotransferase Glp [Desulfobacteria bacterium]